MKSDLKFTDVTPDDDTKYKHNSESETNSPYIVVGTLKACVPLTPLRAFLIHQVSKGHMSMDS